LKNKNNVMPSISYAITACNEHVELERLLDHLNDWIREEDEIIIQLDTTATEEVKQVAFKYPDLVNVTAFPLANTVEGLTQEHIQKWGWSVNENGWVNYPDYQTRILKNIPEIKWINKVHERLVGAKNGSHLPEEYNLIHPKTIERQEKQNQFYNTL